MPVKKKHAMDPKEIVELLELTGWTQVHLAKVVYVHESAVSLWLSGERAPGGPAVALLRQELAKAREKNKKQPA